MAGKTTAAVVEAPKGSRVAGLKPAKHVKMSVPKAGGSGFDSRRVHRRFGDMYLLVADTETTGLDPATGHLLEFGLVVVNERLDVITQVSYIWPNDTPVQELIASADPKVQQMHIDNGLWAEVHAEQQARWAQPVEGARLARTRYSEILSQLYTGLAQFGIATNAQAIMVGRNPGFDKRWLEVKAPEVAKLFSYQMIDIVAFEKRCVQRYGESAKWGVKQGHRALSDCLNEIEELKHYENNWMIPF